MSIQENVMNALKNNKKDIEVIQWGIMNSVASLIYSEYISDIRKQQYPTMRIFIPEIRYVSELVSENSELMNHLRGHLVMDMRTWIQIYHYIDAPELMLFDDNHLEIMESILDAYILPNISKRLPETIAIKFGLNETGDHDPRIQEDSSIDLFGRKPFTTDQYDYITEEAMLQVLTLIPSMNKEITFVENNKEFILPYNFNGYILTVNNAQAICPIQYSRAVIYNHDVIDMLNFVTSTNIKDTEDGGKHIRVTTGFSNQCCITKLLGIKKE